MKTFQDKITWTDIVRPSKNDIAFLKEKFNIHPIILEELMSSSARAKVESYDGYLYLVYHLPVYDAALRTSRQAEIDFLIFKDHVVTVRYEDLEPIDIFTGNLNASSDFREKVLGGNTLSLVYHMVESTIAFSLRQLRHIEENIKNISLEIFHGNGRKLLEKISYVKRDLLDYHLIRRPQRIVLASFAAVSEGFWGKKAKIFVDDLMGDEMKVQQHIEHYVETIKSLEETNAQRLNVKMNRSMQTFTILAFFTFPLALFTAVYSLPDRTMEFWFWFVVIGIGTIALPFLFLRRDMF
jgi:magnesium transporter